MSEDSLVYGTARLAECARISVKLGDQSITTHNGLPGKDNVSRLLLLLPILCRAGQRFIAALSHTWSLGGYEFGLEIESVLGKFEKTIYNDI